MNVCYRVKFINTNTKRLGSLIYIYTSAAICKNHCGIFDGRYPNYRHKIYKSVIDYENHPAHLIIIDEKNQGQIVAQTRRPRVTSLVQKLGSSLERCIGSFQRNSQYIRL